MGALSARSTQQEGTSWRAGHWPGRGNVLRLVYDAPTRVMDAFVSFNRLLSLWLVSGKFAYAVWSPDCSSCQSSTVGTTMTLLDVEYDTRAQGMVVYRRSDVLITPPVRHLPVLQSSHSPIFILAEPGLLNIF